jgi:hypothetical protein
MKTKKIAIVILGMALALYILIPGLSWAEDGAARQAARYKYVSSAACGTQPLTTLCICTISEISRSPNCASMALEHSTQVPSLVGA